MLKQCLWRGEENYTISGISALHEGRARKRSYCNVARWQQRKTMIWMATADSFTYSNTTNKISRNYMLARKKACKRTCESCNRHLGFLRAIRWSYFRGLQARNARWEFCCASWLASFRFASVPVIVDCLHFCFTNGLSFCSAQVRAVKSGKVFILCYHFDSRKLIYLQHFSLFLQHLLQICLRDQFRAIYLEADFKLDSTILLKNILKILYLLMWFIFFLS